MDKIKMNYFYGAQAEQFSYIRIPKELVVGSEYSDLSVQAKILYGILLDRMERSYENKWLDDENRVFIYFSLEDTKKMLNCKDNKAIDIRKALEEIGLIECKRQGQGKPTKIYVKSFFKAEEMEVQRLEKPTLIILK